MMSRDDEFPDIGGNGLVPRPQGQLLDYPVDCRWEVTRRHPYYLGFWEDAKLYYTEPDAPPEQIALRQGAAMMLGLVGCLGEPQDPGTEFEDLDDGEVDPQFLCGSVQPVTLRALAVTLINALPPAERAVVGAILTTSGQSVYAIEGDDADRSLQKQQALMQLARMPSPALDSVPDVPLHYVHTETSLRTIHADITEQVKRWKTRRGTEETRVQTKKLSLYLEVWDLREGWTGSGYDRSRERTLQEIAMQLERPIETVASRFKSAFKMITGCDFAPGLWWRLFGMLKLSKNFGATDEDRRYPLLRRLRSPVRRPVPEGVLGRRGEDSHASGVVEQESAVSSNEEFFDSFESLNAELEPGMSEEELMEKLGIDNPEDVAWVMRRMEEWGEASRDGS